MRQDERIGIVGGVGPHAGLDLTRKLFDHTRAEADQEHLPVMLYSFPDRIGERPAFLLGKTADNPGEAIGDIMAELARAGATVIGMPCNTAHSPRILDAALEKLNATGRPVRFVHMIDAVVRHVRQRCGEGARVILGCTEIPLALPEKELGGVPLIDATDVLARELVRAFAPEKLR